MFLIGDWLAYGDFHFSQVKGGGKFPAEFYAELELATGIKANTLRDARTVCRRFPLSSRLEGVNFWHLREITGAVGENQDELRAWQKRTSDEKMSQPKLRSELRKAYAKYGKEGVDPDRSFNVEIDAFVAKFMRQCDEWHPRYWETVAQRMAPVVEKLRPYSARRAED